MASLDQLRVREVVSISRLIGYLEAESNFNETKRIQNTEAIKELAKEMEDIISRISDRPGR